MAVEQMQLEIQKACGFPLTSANYGKVNICILDKNDNVIILSEDMDFDYLYKVKQFPTNIQSSQPYGMFNQNAILQQNPPTQNHSLLYSPTTISGASLFKSPNIGESHHQYRGSILNGFR